MTAISQAKNLKVLRMEELIGRLLTHELILNKSNENTKSKKTLVLKANEETETSEEENDDETALLTRTFTRLVKKKGTKHRRVPPSCYNCKKIGHM